MVDQPRVVVTRTANQAAAFCQKLREAGFAPVAFPAIRLVPLAWDPLDEALAALQAFDWLIFTSVNAVDFFLRRVDALNLALDRLPLVAAVGSATAQRLAERDIAISYMPDAFVGLELVRGLGNVTGRRVLLPRAKIGRPEIVELLQAQGAILTEVPLYDTVTAVPTAAAWTELTKGFSAITFTSPSSVRNFFNLMASCPEGLAASLAKMVREAQVVCIGPTTAEAAAEAGLANVLVPGTFTIEGMVQQLTTALPVKQR